MIATSPRSDLLCALRAGAVVVHWLDLDRAADAALRAGMPSTEELERAARLRRASDRRRYLGAHAALRVILAGYAAVPPREVRCETNGYGKPTMVGAARLRFNLTHSRRLGAVAVAYDRALGIDVEYARSDRALRDVARRFFSGAEVQALERIGGAAFVAAFHRCWTRKEAYAKARGLGLSLPLDSFDVSLARRPRSALLATRPDARDTARWEIRDVTRHRAYPAALAVERGACRDVLHVA